MKCPELLDLIAQQGCCVCGGSAEIHHMRYPWLTGMSQRASDVFVIPLCSDHHRGKNGFHAFGRRAWEGIYGTQLEHYEKTMIQVIKSLLK
jgi:hypothetical protein